ncbi:MAG TPA: GNAT family N-acetyltransferase [Nocardioidaceae bacterium]|nr:GNAT family N-acetyltransferase [Nocardioidaceae bacterium]
MTVRLEPMTQEQYETWLPDAIEGYAHQTSDSGLMSLDTARESAVDQFEALLPDDLATPAHHLLVAYDEGQVVGNFWVRIRDEWGIRRAFIFDIEVVESQRGHGYGRAIMNAGEEYVRGLGASTMALNVFAQNDVARSLYDKLGYLVTNVNMQKELV